MPWVSSSLISAWPLFIVALLSCLSLLTRVGAQNSSREVSALLQFKDFTDVTSQRQTDGSFFEQRGYWNSWKRQDQNPCSWLGITCSPNFTVQTIDLSGWGVDRLLGLSSLSALKDLQELDLSNNELSGTKLPEEIRNLTGLTRLDLSRNGFVGEIPDSINDCKALRSLSLEQNSFEGEIPSFLGLTKLQVLSLAYNKLTGRIPDEFNELTSLVSLDLSNNLLNGSVPSLQKLTNLLDLNLDNNYFSTFDDPLLPVPTSLRHLSISGNQLEGSIPSGLVNLLDLEVLNMSSTQLSGNIPMGLARQSNHSFWLDLSQNQLVGEIPTDLLESVPASTVVSLNLSHNLLGGEIRLNWNVGGGSWYDVLDLSHNQLEGLLPHLTGQNDSLYLPVYLLWLQNNHLSGDIVDLLLSGHSFAYTAELRLENNVFTGDLTRMVDSWASFNDLFRVLDLSNNKLQMLPTKEYPDPLSSTLERLTITSAREFRLGGNNFSGLSLPAVYLSSSNVHLEVLDLSNSQLQGQISGAVFNSKWLPSLRYLNLSNNEATGSIPGNLFLSKNLSVVDVSNNNLSGVIPAIPVESSLYNPTFFAGNLELCGAPVETCFSTESWGHVEWWVLLIIVVLAVKNSACNFACIYWRWRVYSRKHRQDEDLIRTLLERDSVSLMPLRDLKKATNDFDASSQIGVGGFGTVYLGKLSNGTTVAIKRSKREGTERDKQQFLNEIRVLTQVNHRHLVKLLGCCMENKIALLVLEYVSNGTLQEHLHGMKGAVRLSWKQRVRIAVQTAEALNYLHSAASFPIFHRDVKSANILLTDDLNAKVSDFGISKLVPEEATHASTAAVQGTFGYLDPEYYTSCQLTAKSDVYSFGVVLLELISAKGAIDLSRGEDKTSLVSFSIPIIESGDLEPLLDPALEETYREPTGKESILNVGTLALKCSDMRSKARPNMNQVLKELHSLFMELNGTSDYMVDIDSPGMKLSSLERMFMYRGEDSSVMELPIKDISALNKNIQLTEFSLNSEPVRKSTDHDILANACSSRSKSTHEQ